MSKIKKIRRKSGKIVYEVFVRKGGRSSKQIRKCFYKRVEADDFLRELETQKRERQLGVRKSGSFLDATFKEHADKWLRQQKLNVSTSWYNTSVSTVKDFCKQYGHYTLDKIHRDFLVDLQLDLKDREGRKDSNWKNATVNRYTEVILAVINYAVNTKKIPYSPARGFKKLPKNQPEMLFWEPHEALSFLEFVKHKYQSYDLKDYNNCIQHYLVYATLLSTGVRPGEAWGLMPKDISLPNDDGSTKIHIRRQFNRVDQDFGPIKCERNSKNDKSRYIPCSSELYAPLKRFLENNSISKNQTLFKGHNGGPVDHRVFRNRFIRDVKAWGGTIIRLYDLRHTAATWMLYDNVRVKTVQAILGHSRIESTMNYVHLLGNDINEVARKRKVLPEFSSPKLTVLRGVSV